MKLRKILIIEDEFHVGYLLKISLEAEGYEAILALGGEEGLEKVRATSPDLVTLDVLMPDMDGFQVLEVLKRDKELNSIPVIMISVVNEIRKKKGLRMGALDYLLKPIDFDNLLDKIKRLELGESPPD